MVYTAKEVNHLNLFSGQRVGLQSAYDSVRYRQDEGISRGFSTLVFLI